MDGSPPTSRGTPSGGKSQYGAAEGSGSAPPSSSSTPLPASSFTLKSTSTFTSCLSIPVQGAVPIESLREEVASSSRMGTSNSARASSTDPSAKRAQRKSKTDALAALQQQQKDGPAGEDPHSQEFENSFVHYGPPIAVSPTLNLDSVKTATSRGLPPPVEPRPFGIEDCPEFYPTPEEFKDPMAYVRSISDRAKEYGICKIIPPADWKMPFVTDTETFRFKTRLQRLNSIEASSRAKINFLEQLYRFHKQQGNPRVSVPTINHKPLDLWLLRKEVQALGGYEAVGRNKKWSDLGRILGYGGIPGLSSQLKNSYTRVILPYEHFVETVRNSPTMSPVTPRDSQLKTHTNIQSVSSMQMGSPSKPSRLSTNVTNADDATPPSSPLTEESVLSDAESEPDNTLPQVQQSISAPVRRSTRGLDSTRNADASSSGHGKEKEEPRVVQEQNCEVCQKKNRGEEMLLCDGCDCGFHMFCLDPPLTVIPKGQWFCHTCLFGTGHDFGFEEGEEHSLSSFQARDLEFRRMWFESHPPPITPSNAPGVASPTVNVLGKVAFSEYDVENEFWRLVQSPQETVEIEYGADVHSMTHGSAMPTLETYPLNPYSKDPWNVNNIPIVADSLLRFIKSDISGMTVPWTYVGMMFSTFCWHNEDHYTSSVNFMHFGETKTWYGIPGDDADKFEAAIKSEAPDLFEAQPDLLFQLVTLMNPRRLQEAGVRVYGCNQRAGEFVITFPKAYHAGFNHGFNFNEAVNFAMPDWLSHGKSCVARYREHRKTPVFSHDELLVTITQQSTSIKTASWLLQSLDEMTTREMADRKKARALGMSETLDEKDRPEEQIQCTICKTFCYLSQVTCKCTGQIACVEHAEVLCVHSSNQLSLRKRYSDETLLDTLSKVQQRALVPDAWVQKMRSTIAESARPPLRSLRALLSEGERITYWMPELQALRKCVNRANEWLEAANGFIVRKQIRKRLRRARKPANNEVTPGVEEGGEKSLEDLYTLLREIDNLGFETPETETLKTLARAAEELKVEARILLAPGDEGRSIDFVNDCKTMLSKAANVNVHLEEIVEVENVVLREGLLAELETLAEKMTLEEIRNLLTRARACNLPSGHARIVDLEAKQRAGDNWEERAQNILAQPFKTIEELEDFSKLDPAVPIDTSVLNRLLAALQKGREYERQAKVWISPEIGALKPRLQEVMKLVTKAERDFNIPAVQNLKRTAEYAIEMENRCEAVLNDRFEQRDNGEVFKTVAKWQTYANEHLHMFALPSFEKLNLQLVQHERWLEDMPWKSPEQTEEQSQLIGDTLYKEIMASTRDDDDQPPSDDFITCICIQPVRPPMPGCVSDAVQCDHCFARFHGECARNGGSCPFCDHHHWNGTIHKERSWHSCFLPTILVAAPEVTKHYSPEWKQLELIVHRLDRLTGVIGQFLAFSTVVGNQRHEYIQQVRHFMRKLFKIQFAVAATRDASLGLDLASLHRLLASQPQAVKQKKRKRPRFTFGQDVDRDWHDGTRCICRGRTGYLLHYPAVNCDTCGKRYHSGCVFHPSNESDKTEPFTCPLCCLRKNKPYPFSEVRVKQIDTVEPDTYVNVKEMLDTFSKDLIFVQMVPPYTQTLFVELIRFVPGQPENASAPAPRPAQPPSSARRTPPSANGLPVSHHPNPINSSYIAPPVAQPEAGPSNSVEPNAAWSRWGTVHTPNDPPGQASGSVSNRKRKAVEDPPMPPSTDASGSPRSPKRRGAVITMPASMGGRYGGDTYAAADAFAIPTLQQSSTTVQSPHMDSLPHPSSSRASASNVMSPSLAKILGPSSTALGGRPVQGGSSHMAP